MKTLDVLALELPRALKRCAAAGWYVLIRFTAPPKGNMSGPARVVCCKLTGDRYAVLTVAREQKKGGVASGLPHH